VTRVTFLFLAVLLQLSLGSFVTALNAQNLPDNMVEVRGELIDIRKVSAKETFFPQCKKSKLSSESIARLGEGQHFAVSLLERRGPLNMRCGKNAPAVIALDYDGTLPGKWKQVGVPFEVYGITYWIYENRKAKKGEWIDVPYPEGCCHSAVVFGSEMAVADVPQFGTLICQVRQIRNKGAYNQTICMLPDGSYLAACTLGLPTGPVMYISRDKGRSWQPHGTYTSRLSKVMNYHNLFVHDGDVYLCGVGKDREGLIITKSTDGGLTWSNVRDSKTGIILNGKYHTAPVPMVVCDGRIWRACETYPDKSSFMLSAPVESELLDAANWTRTNTVGRGSKLIDGNKMSGSMIEGNAVVDTGGKVVNLIRTNSSRTSGYATILHTEGIDSLYFNSETDWVRMPGGGKKFTVRYDEKSGLYWSLTNPDSMEKANHQGLETKDGLSHSLMRNKLVLICSPDLRNWRECKVVMYDPDPFFHGFQYADWIFDGDDIAAVVRVGAPESRGLPTRQHDSNQMVFVKVENFRSY